MTYLFNKEMIFKQWKRSRNFEEYLYKCCRKYCWWEPRSAIDLEKIEIISERYESYSSISNPRKHPEQANCCLIAEVCTNDVLNLIKGISINKAIREDQKPSKLVKEFCRISYCCYKLLLQYQHFSDLAKEALVTPIDKFGTEKHVYLNYRPLSTSNIRILHICPINKKC